MDPRGPEEAPNNDSPKKSMLQSLEFVNAIFHSQGDFADVEKVKNLKIEKLS